MKHMLLKAKNKSIVCKQRRKNIAQLTGVHTIHVNTVKVILL